MADMRVRWLVGWSAACLVSCGFWTSYGLTQSSAIRPAQSLGTSNGTTLAPKMSRAQEMKPLTPAKAAPIIDVNAVDLPQGCVVLHDGRVFQGAVTQLPEAYQVKSSTGSVVFTFDQVRTVATSLPQASVQLRESYETPTTNDHLLLGQWCLQNNLFEEASQEAEAALGLEPTRKEALTILKKSEEALGRVPKEVPAGDKVQLRAMPDGGVVSAESQLEFTRHVNRIALNKCGNGACHGSSSFSSFKLSRSSKSDPNLKMFLKYIDPSDPEMSPLLVNSQSADGPHKGLFLGAKGREQFATIQAWVVQVANEQNNLAEVRRRPQPRRESGPVITIRPKNETREGQNAASIEPGESDPEMALDNAPEVDITGESPEIKTVAAEMDAPAMTPARSKRRDPLKSETIQKLLQSQDPDAFDPEEFNRMVHGNRATPVE